MSICHKICYSFIVLEKFQRKGCPTSSWDEGASLHRKCTGHFRIEKKKKLSKGKSKIPEPWRVCRKWMELISSAFLPTPDKGLSQWLMDNNFWISSWRYFFKLWKVNCHNSLSQGDLVVTITDDFRWKEIDLFNSSILWIDRDPIFDGLWKWQGK